MNPARPSNSKELLTLQEAADILAVSPSILLEWNEHNILKPTITQSGEIGYTRDQIEQFAFIRSLNRSRTDANQGYQSQQVNQSPIDYVPTNSVSVPMTPPSQPQNSGQYWTQNPVNNTQFQAPHLVNVKTKMKHSPLLFITSSCAVILIILATLILIQQGTFNSKLASLNTKSESTNETKHTSNLPIAEKVIVALPIELDKDKNTQKEPIGENENANHEALASIYKEPAEATPAATQNNKGKIATSKVVLSASTSANNTTKDLSQITTYASTSTCTDCAKNDTRIETSTIDSRGNIRGQTSKPEVLASTLGSLGGNYSDASAVKQMNSTPLNQLIFLSIGAIAGIFILQKQIASTLGSLQFAATNNNTQTRIDFAAQRILEVEQKMDGTVVLIFQGTEYKICKPELYSESDRFIERLMALSGTDLKEMEYDILKDRKVMLSSPLSRLATRLGFVGIKRELFFPRTSKHQVLFRKWLTRNDLANMGLSIEQVATELFNEGQNMVPTA